jgi:SAM-dependent methyltransferase
MKRYICTQVCQTMNRIHRWLCSSTFWRFVLVWKLIPWALDGLHLGDKVLEVGPGPGLTTAYLSKRCPDLTALEIDEKLAASLQKNLSGTGVEVRLGNACEMPFQDASFSTVVAFTMLHHVPSVGLQDRLFGEVHRVLRPGGTFAGTDSRDSWGIRLIHLHDTMILVDPAALSRRLAEAGFTDIQVDSQRRRFRFSAHKPVTHPANL